MTARLLIGDVFERMAEIPDGSVDLLLTSPPFLALRSYLPDDHPDKAKEIGSEATPAEFLDTLLELTAVWRRLLAPYGSLVVELGDTYAGSGGAGGDYKPGGWRSGQPGAAGSMKHEREHKVDGWGPFRDEFKGGGPGGAGWPLEKSLTGIPTLYTWSLAYGRNLLRRPLTARELLDEAERFTASVPGLSASELLAHLRWTLCRWEERGRGPGVEIEPWRIRNLKPWIRTNPPVGALGDKERPATSYITVATLARDRWFDLDAVRTTAAQPDGKGDRSDRRTRVAMAADGKGDPAHHGADPAGAPPLDWVHIVDLILDNELHTNPDANGHDLVGALVRAGVVPNPLNIAALIDAELARRAGQPPPGGNGAGRHRKMHGGNDSEGEIEAEGTVGARGHHLRRALERHGYFTTLDALDISPKGYAGAHYAVWPPELCQRLIDEMCPRRVCTTCGQPSRRMTENPNAGTGRNAWNGDVGEHGFGNRPNRAERITLGWSDCGHNTWRPGHVLDPFAGSGTTLAVATGMGRNATGIDIDPRNADLARERCGMFLEIDEGNKEGVA